jgi:hypothetical protein
MTTIVQGSEGPAPSARFCGTEADLRALCSDLEQRRRFRVEQLRQLDAPLHPRVFDGPGGARTAVTVDLVAAATVALSEVEEALARIADTSYGLCEACGAAIALPRLRELPMVRWCASCPPADEAESRRRVKQTPELDLVDEWGRESFPASDPPANW